MTNEWQTKEQPNTPHDINRRAFLTGMSAIGVGVALTASGCSSSSGKAGSGGTGKGSVTVYDGGGAWGAAQEAAYFGPFEKETGIKVVRNPGLDPGKILAGIKVGAPGYDVVDIAGGTLNAWVTQGKTLLPIDYKFMDPRDKAGFSPVPAHKYGVPALLYSSVIAWNAKKISGQTPTSWADFWDTKTFPGERALSPGNWGSGGTVFEQALLGSGVSPSALYPLDFDRAFKSLDRLKPDLLKYWQTGAEPTQLIESGEVALTSAPNGRVSDAQANGVKVGFTWDQGIIQYDYWAVPQGAKNPENAMQFVAFASRAEQQAKFAEAITYSPTNELAFALLSKERAALMPTSPAFRAKQILQDYGFWNLPVSGGGTNNELAIKRWEQWVAG